MEILKEFKRESIKNEESIKNKKSIKNEECISMQSMENTLPKYPTPNKKEELQVKYLLSLEKIEQRTEQWYKTRMNMITASDWAAALNKGKFKNKKDLILKKCGKGKVFKGNIYTEWGVKYEDVAIRLYEIRNGTTVYEFGILQHPKYDFLGASPDGITSDGIMIEIKCPFKRKLIIGKVPENYMTQIQGQLEVCDLSLCDYLECQIEEYKSEEDYFEDTLEDELPKINKTINPKILENNELKMKYNKKLIFNKTRKGMEKGITLVYEDNNRKKKYIHSELGLSKEEYIKWKKNIQNYPPDPNYKFMNSTFWKVIRFNCVRVKRDRVWFEESLPKLSEVWNLIKHHRVVGCEKLYSARKKRRSHFEINNDMNDDLNNDLIKLLDELGM